MCAATGLSMFATLTLNSSAAPSSRSLSVATPTAWVSRAGTSWSPDSWATKLSPAEAGAASARSANAPMRTSMMVLRIAFPPRVLGLPAEDFVDRALIQPDHEEVAVRPGLDVGHYPEVRADERALAVGDVELVVVVGDPRSSSRGSSTLIFW